MSDRKTRILRFGVFELDAEAEQLRKNGLTIRLQPQPFKLLRLLVDASGHVVTRDEIRAALWTGDTFVDFEQGVNFAIKQVRAALEDDADRSLYIQTIPKRGYRFVAPVEVVGSAEGITATLATDAALHKALWVNITELRLAEESRRKRFKIAIAAMVFVLAAMTIFLMIRTL